MKFDIEGRIENMRLPDGKTAILYSVYEAVSNSIHAINDRFKEENAAEKGDIEVWIDHDAQGYIDSIKVIDNGIGFNAPNLKSFDTSDSRFKYSRGGKGVGRLIWIKTFENIEVDSVYMAGRSKARVRFRFDPRKQNSFVGKRVTEAAGMAQQTTIKLSGMRGDQGSRVRTTSYLKDLALHFFPQFVSGTLPRITIHQNGEADSLNDFIDEHVESPIKTVVPVDLEGERIELTINHLFVDPQISTTLRNSYLLTAHGRLVGEPVSIERKYALKDLDSGRAYVAIVSSPFLDNHVDQERLGFKLTAEQKEKIEAAIFVGAEQFLSDHIAFLRTRQVGTIKGLLEEHPQLASQITNIDDYVASLSPSMDDEQIAQNLFVLLYRDERELRQRIDELRALDSLAPEAKKEAEDALQEISNQEKHRLAELVVKRHQVLQLANLLLKYKDEDEASYFHERVIHELIFPMGEMLRSGDFADHNLWVLDDSLAAYEFVASDKPIKSFSDSPSRREPDLVFFNPLGFRREGSTDPVVIVEFKRPGDEKPSQDPVNQVLQYIDDLRSSRVKDVQGAVISDITDKTPFECIIVCELTDKARRLFERSLAQNPTPDGEGYYGWSRQHGATIRVISFKKMLRDAEARNQAFFDQLKLGRPSTAAKKRSAKQAARKIAQPTN